MEKNKKTILYVGGGILAAILTYELFLKPKKGTGNNPPPNTGTGNNSNPLNTLEQAGANAGSGLLQTLLNQIPGFTQATGNQPKPPSGPQGGNAGFSQSGTSSSQGGNQQTGNQQTSTSQQDTSGNTLDPNLVSDPTSQYYDPSSPYYDPSLDTTSASSGNEYDPSQVSDPSSPYYDPSSAYYDSSLDTSVSTDNQYYTDTSGSGNDGMSGIRMSGSPICY